MEEIIDKYLNHWSQLELNKLPINIEPEMADPNQDPSKEWKTWFPIPSKVTDEELAEFENQLGKPLPDSYKRFLKHKHFYDLSISECTFFRHPVNTWKTILTNEIFDGYPTEYLIDKGRIPFASWSDWGLLCFDTSANYGNNDYPIVLWDHEVEDEIQKKYRNFENMLNELDKEEKETA